MRIIGRQSVNLENTRLTGSGKIDSGNSEQTVLPALVSTLCGSALAAGKVATRTVGLQAIAEIRASLDQTSSLVIDDVLLAAGIESSVKLPLLTFAPLRIEVAQEFLCDAIDSSGPCGSCCL